VKRKVTVAEDISRRVAGTLKVAYEDRGYEFIFIPDVAGYGEQDEFWAVKFRRFGGEIVLTADKNISSRPHQLRAFKDDDLICFFMAKRWTSRPMWADLERVRASTDSA
jgi:hypothetical protein